MSLCDNVSHILQEHLNNYNEFNECKRLFFFKSNATNVLD